MKRNLIILASILIIIYMAVFIRSLNPDKVNLAEHTWIKMFTADIRDFNSKLNFITVYCQKDTSKIKLFSSTDSAIGKRTTFNFVIVRDSILPFGTRVISPIYNEPILLSESISENDSLPSKSVAWADLGSDYITPLTIISQIWGSGYIYLKFTIHQSAKDKNGYVIVTVNASNVSIFGGKISNNYHLLKELQKQTWPSLIDIRHLF